MRLLLNNTEVDFASIEKQHCAIWETVITAELDKLIRLRAEPTCTYLKEIKKRIPTLLIGKSRDLRQTKSELEVFRKKIPTAIEKKLSKRLLKIFNYDSFVAAYMPKWGAYQLAESLNVSACAYCNRIFTFTLDRVDQGRRLKKTKTAARRKFKLKDIASAKTRPEFDHFYPKDQFPYLALSIYNLIPSCHVCNSNFKGKRVLNYDDYFNPYEDDFHDTMKITATLRNKDQIQQLIDQGQLQGEVRDHFGTQLFAGKLNSFDLVFTPKNPTSITVNEKAQKHIQLFALAELYELHKSQAARIIKNAIVHGPGAVADIYARHTGLFHSQEEVRSALVGNETDPDKINQSPLSKMTIDILEDFSS
ncbi:MAG: hypothetical protein RL007_549 [Bacteroidota bacterium]|jgi:5-methylcytosine-specific restriction endonuclease McrA